jgi:hypothetical protein
VLSKDKDGNVKEFNYIFNGVKNIIDKNMTNKTVLLELSNIKNYVSNLIVKIEKKNQKQRLNDVLSKFEDKRLSSNLLQIKFQKDCSKSYDKIVEDTRDIKNVYNMYFKEKKYILNFIINGDIDECPEIDFYYTIEQDIQNKTVKDLYNVFCKEFAVEIDKIDFCRFICAICENYCFAFDMYEKYFL